MGALSATVVALMPFLRATAAQQRSACRIRSRSRVAARCRSVQRDVCPAAGSFCSSPLPRKAVLDGFERPHSRDFDRAAQPWHTLALGRASMASPAFEGVRNDRFGLLSPFFVASLAVEPITTRPLTLPALSARWQRDRIRSAAISCPCRQAAAMLAARFVTGRQARPSIRGGPPCLRPDRSGKRRHPCARFRERTRRTHHLG